MRGVRNHELGLEQRRVSTKATEGEVPRAYPFYTLLDEGLNLRVWKSVAGGDRGVGVSTWKASAGVKALAKKE